MAVGDTIAGSVRVVKEETIGHRVVVAGNFDSTEVDKDSTYFMHINPDPRKLIPRGDSKVYAPDGVFEAGEVMEVQHLSASLEEAIDYDASEEFIQVIEEDLNTGRMRMRTLTVADTGLTADPTSSTTVWTTFYKYTVPDRRRIYLAGMFKVSAVETA